MIEIQPHPIGHCTVRVPGSKSYTHRTLIAAALSDGPSKVHNPLRSQDTLLTLSALEKMGAQVADHEEVMEIQGLNGRLQRCADPIYLANSGTSMRLLTGVAALGQGTYRLVEGAGHLIPMEKPEESAALIGGFFKNNGRNRNPGVATQTTASPCVERANATLAAHGARPDSSRCCSAWCPSSS